VAIAGVMALEPKVLILDEPAAGLDPRGRDEILGRIRDYHQQTKSTVLLVSHSMEDVSRNANSILVMNHGRCVMHDTVPAVFEKADALVEMGLDVPKITRVFISLQEKGYPVSRNVYTVEQGKKELMKLLSKGGDSDA
jgi:energy-coupling factor transport system ATP-binding protein